MNVIFNDEALEELYTERKTKNKKYKVLAKDKKLIEGYITAVNIIRGAENINDLKNFSFLHYEKLKYRSDSSVRLVNGRIERLIFVEKKDGIEVLLIEINSDHYGNKK